MPVCQFQHVPDVPVFRWRNDYKRGGKERQQGLRYNPALDTPPWRCTLSRVINLESAGKDRNRLSKAIVLALRELARQNAPGPESRDLAAFIVLALQTIADGIDLSVSAWEKRGYWVKADRFRMEWVWAGQVAAKMKNALLADDWTGIAMLLPQIASKLSKIEVGQNHRLGTPWTGSWNTLRGG